MVSGLPGHLLRLMGVCFLTWHDTVLWVHASHVDTQVFQNSLWGSLSFPHCSVKWCLS